MSYAQYLRTIIEEADSFVKGHATVNSPGHRLHGRTGVIFHKHEDGRINLQLRDPLHRGKIHNLTLKPGEFTLKEEVEITEMNKHSFIGRILRKQELKSKVDKSWKNAVDAEKSGDNKKANKEFNKHVRYANLERPGTWTDVKEETELEESKMSELHSTISDHMDGPISEYKRIGGAEALMGYAHTAALNVAKKHNIAAHHAKKFVSDYIDSKLNESVESDKSTLVEFLSSAAKLKSLVKQLTDSGYEETHSYMAGKYSARHFKHPKSGDRKVIRFGKILDVNEGTEINESVKLFSKSQLDKLHSEYSKIDTIDPASDHYKKLNKFMDGLHDDHLKQIRDHKIPFLRSMASLRLALRKGSVKEETELDEGVSEISKGYYEYANGKRPSGKSYGWLFSTVHPAKHSWDKHKDQTYQHSGEATFTEASKAAVKYFKDKGHTGDIHVLS
jgi:hypothetical protein